MYKFVLKKDYLENSDIIPYIAMSDFQYPKDVDNWLLVEADQLPPQWYVKTNKDNIDILRSWYKWKYLSDECIVGIPTGGRKSWNPINEIHGKGFSFGVEITFELFLKFYPEYKTKNMKTEFEKGDYIVILKNGDNCGQFNDNYCYKQRENASFIRCEKDLEGDENGREKIKFKSDNWRFATQEEINIYESLGKPFDTTLKINIKRYEFKKECEQFRKAAFCIAKFAGDFEKYSDNVNSFDKGSNVYRLYKDAGVLDLWFKPIYEFENSLPKIGGYDGVITPNKDVKYGCTEFNGIALRSFIASAKILFKNIPLKYISLGSNITVTYEELLKIEESLK